LNYFVITKVYPLFDRLPKVFKILERRRNMIYRRLPIFILL